MSSTTYYRLSKETLHHEPERICTAAVWSCSLCGSVIDGMGGPGNGEICVLCGDDIISGRLKYYRIDAALKGDDRE